MQPQWNFGIDADKCKLNINLYGEETVTQVDNQAKPIKAWLKTLPASSRIGVESTSHYHELLARLAKTAGHQVFVLNARDVRDYARGIGRRGKTDKVDARVIARYVAKEGDELHPYVPRTHEQQAMHVLQQQRGVLKSSATQLRQALTVRGPLTQDYRRLMRELNNTLIKVDRQIKALLANNQSQWALFQRLMTVPGIGPVVAACLVHHLERWPLKHSDAWIACTGLDPRPQDSGQKIGRRRLSKRGPGVLRQMLFMAAMSFARSPLGKPIYQHHRNHKQLSSTAAYNVIARLIARLAWALRKTGEDFNPQLFRATHARPLMA